MIETIGSILRDKEREIWSVAPNATVYDAIALMVNPIILTHKLTDLYLGDVLGAPSGSGGPAAAKVTLKESELAGRAGSYRVTSDPGLADLQVSVRDGKLIGHSFYDDDLDFDLIPTDATHVRAPGPTTLEFVPAALGHPPEWHLNGSFPQQILKPHRQRQQPRDPWQSGNLGCAGLHPAVRLKSRKCLHPPMIRGTNQL